MNTQRALVTGATGGIGRAIGLALAEQARRDGAELRIVAAASRAGPALQAVVDEWTSAGAQAVGLAADLTDPQSCASLVERAQQACGGLSLLVSNAGASVRGALADLPIVQWDATFNLNVRATWLLAQAARPALSAARGSIVAIASMSGLHPHPGYGAYSPAKAALIMLCRQLAQEWAADGIRINAVCPGMIRTPLTEAVYQDAGVARQREALVPLARIGRGEDVAAAVAWLASAGASYVTGQQLVVDGGLADHMLALIPGRAAKPAA
jgi:glucose 1-dehydrogenase